MRWTALFVPSTLAISTLLLWALPALAEDIVDYDGQFIAAADFIISNNRADFTLDTSRGPLTVTISNDSVPYSAFTPGATTIGSRIRFIDPNCAGTPHVTVNFQSGAVATTFVGPSSSHTIAVWETPPNRVQVTLRSELRAVPEPTQAQLPRLGPPVVRCINRTNPETLTVAPASEVEDAGLAQFQFPFFFLPNPIVDACEAELGQCLAAVFDADSDGIPNPLDSCEDTLQGKDVDASGCSQDQFCNSVDASAMGGKKLCENSDWKNDEPVMKRTDQDCAFDNGGPGREDDRCVPL